MSFKSTCNNALHADTLSGETANLQQQLILHDSLNRFDEQIVELQPVTQLLPEILSGDKKGVSKYKEKSLLRATIKLKYKGSLTSK